MHANIKNKKAVKQDSARLRDAAEVVWADRLIVIAGIVAIGLTGACIAYAYALWQQSSAVAYEVKGLTQQLAIYTEGEKNPPNSKREEFLKESLSVINGSIDACKRYDIVWSDVIAPYRDKKSPLAFKEAVFSLREEIRVKANETGVELPATIGFQEWQDKLPSRDKIAGLYQSMDVIRKLLLMAVNVRVTGVRGVTFSETEEISLNTALKQSVYYEREITLRLTATYAQYKQFVQDIKQSRFLFNIGYMALSDVQANLGAEERRMGKSSFPISALNEEAYSSALLDIECTVINTYL